jgi:hypothetical protein
LASARIAPVLGSTAIAVALLGEYVLPTCASTRSTCCCSPESIVSWTIRPGSVARRSSIEIGWPFASLTIRRRPLVPWSTLLYWYSIPLAPSPSRCTEPISPAASAPRG